MDRIPLLRNGSKWGEVLVQREETETMFHIRGRLPQNELCNVWVIGDGGELRLGIPGLTGTEAVLEKRFSRRMTEHLGRLLYGELRPTCERSKEQVMWKSVHESNRIRTEWLYRQLHCWPGAICSDLGKRRLIAVPYVMEKPFPMMPMFCFASLQMICGRLHLVIQLDEKEKPQFQ